MLKQCSWNQSKAAWVLGAPQYASQEDKGIRPREGENLRHVERREVLERHEFDESALTAPGAGVVSFRWKETSA